MRDDVTTREKRERERRNPKREGGRGEIDQTLKV